MQVLRPPWWIGDTPSEDADARPYNKRIETEHNGARSAAENAALY